MVEAVRFLASIILKECQFIKTDVSEASQTNDRKVEMAKLMEGFSSYETSLKLLLILRH
jgi:hypothetical protein